MDPGGECVSESDDDLKIRGKHSVRRRPLRASGQEAGIDLDDILPIKTGH